METARRSLWLLQSKGESHVGEVREGTEDAMKGQIVVMMK